jgi:phosphatidylinositol alpha-1,6-mannosyltransferase
MGGMETQNYYLVNGINQNHEVVKIIILPGQSRLQFFSSLKKRVKTILNSESAIKIIHLNDGLMAFMLHWLPDYTELPIVITYHGLDLIFPNKFYQKRLKKYHRSNCYFVAVSTYTREKGIESGIDKNRIICIDNGVDHDFGSNVELIEKKYIFKKYAIPQNENHIYMISIGRAVPRKGFSWVIKHVMPELDNHYQYIIIGPNNVTCLTKLILSILPSSWSRFLSTLMGFTTDYHKAKKEAKKKGIEKRIHFLGGIPFNELVSLLKSSDLMVMPNISFNGDMEGFGLVILEANICEKFVLASDLEGIRSAIHQEKNGIRIANEKADQWIAKIKEICNSKSLLDKKGKEASAYVKQNFSWTKMTKEYELFFEKIIEHKKD